MMATISMGEGSSGDRFGYVRWLGLQMRRAQRTRLRVIEIGLLATLTTVVLHQTRWLLPVENLLYDARAARCQLFNKSPTTRVLHLDVDDKALQVIGRWPWSRSTLARVLDEIGRAGPKVVGLD